MTPVQEIIGVNFVCIILLSFFLFLNAKPPSDNALLTKPGPLSKNRVRASSRLSVSPSRRRIVIANYSKRDDSGSR